MKFKKYMLFFCVINLSIFLNNCGVTNVTTIAINKNEINEKIIIETFNSVLYFDKSDCIIQLENELLNHDICNLRVAVYGKLIHFLRSNKTDTYFIKYCAITNWERDINFLQQFINNETDIIATNKFINLKKSKYILPYGYIPVIDTSNKIKFPILPEIILNKLILAGKVKVYNKIFDKFEDTIKIRYINKTNKYEHIAYSSGIYIKSLNFYTDAIYDLGECDEENKYNIIFK